VEAQYKAANAVTPREGEGNPPSARHLCEDALPDPKRRRKGLPFATRMQMVRLIYLAEKSQDKWNKIINSDTVKTENQMDV
jgi:hypothetical protein